MPETGAFLGSIALNYGVAGLAVLAVVIGGFALTLPDPPVLNLTLLAAAVAVVVPVAFYPFASTLWVAVDWLLRTDERRSRGDRDPRCGAGEGSSSSNSS